MIDVPKELNDEQEKAVEQLSKTLGSDDLRESLFGNGAGPRPRAGATSGKASDN